MLALSTLLWRFHWAHAIGPLAHDAARMTSYALPRRTGIPWWVFVAAYAVAYAWLLRVAARRFGDLVIEGHGTLSHVLDPANVRAAAGVDAAKMAFSLVVGLDDLAARFVQVFQRVQHQHVLLRRHQRRIRRWRGAWRIEHQAILRIFGLE